MHSKKILWPLDWERDLENHFCKLMISEYPWILPQNWKLGFPISGARVIPEPTDLRTVLLRK